MAAQYGQQCRRIIIMNTSTRLREHTTNSFLIKSLAGGMWIAKKKILKIPVLKFSGEYRSRTDDLLHAMQAL